MYADGKEWIGTLHQTDDARHDLANAVHLLLDYFGSDYYQDRDNDRDSDTVLEKSWQMSRSQTRMRMMTDKPKRGGPNRGQGRKPLLGERCHSTSIALTQAQKEKLKRLGGAAWVRRQIDEAE